MFSVAFCITQLPLCFPILICSKTIAKGVLLDFTGATFMLSVTIGSTTCYVTGALQVGFLCTYSVE